MIYQAIVFLPIIGALIAVPVAAAIQITLREVTAFRTGRRALGAHPVAPGAVETSA